MEAVVVISFFIIVHSITAFYLLTDHKYIGEAYSVGSVSIDSAIIVLMFLLLIAGYMYIRRRYIKSDKLLRQRKHVIVMDEKRFDWFYSIDLLFNLFLYYKYGVGSAVGGGRSNLTFLTSIFSIRALFPFYYVIQRKKRPHYIINVLLYVVLRLLQGWTGFMLTIAIIEIYFYFCKQKQTIPKKIVLSLIAPIGIVAGAGWVYSFIYPMKNYIRFNQVDFRPLSFKEGISTVIDRLSFFPQAIASIQTAKSTRQIYLNDSVFLGEIRGMFRPIFPSAIMDKDFSTLPLCIKQSFVTYKVQGTSLNVGMYSYLYNLVYSDFLAFLFFCVIIALLIYVFRKIIYNLQIEGDHNRILYLLFMLNIFHVTALEPVFSYEYIPIIMMAPFLVIFRVCKIYKINRLEEYAYNTRKGWNP